MDGTDALGQIVRALQYGSPNRPSPRTPTFPQQWAERTQNACRVRVEVVGTSPDVRASVGYLRVQRDEPTRAVRIHFAGGQRVESDGITLEIEMTSVQADTGLWRHAVEVCNVTPFDGDDLDAVMDVSPTSLLVVLYGSFVSSIAPPAHAAAAVAACRCTGLHPVLVGDGAMLGSPIVLPDHPMVDEIFE